MLPSLRRLALEPPWVVEASWFLFRFVFFFLVALSILTVCAIGVVSGRSSSRHFHFRFDHGEANCGGSGFVARSLASLSPNIARRKERTGTLLAPESNDDSATAEERGTGTSLGFLFRFVSFSFLWLLRRSSGLRILAIEVLGFGFGVERGWGRRLMRRLGGDTGSLGGNEHKLAFYVPCSALHPGESKLQCHYHCSHYGDTAYMLLLYVTCVSFVAFVNSNG